MRKLGLSLSFVMALSFAGVALSQQPSVPVSGALSGPSSNGPTVVTDQKLQIVQKIRAAREARASRKSGGVRGHLLGRRRQQGNNVTPPALPAPAQR